MGIIAYFVKKKVLKEKVKAREKINKLLNEALIETVIRGVITLVLNVIGITVVLLKPFGVEASNIIGSIIFWGVLIWYLIRIIRFYVDNAPIISFAVRTIIKDKSISGCIEKYVKNNNPKISKYFSFIAKMAIIFPSWRTIPSLRDIVKELLRYFAKKSLLFIAFYGIYILFVYFVAKPILLREYAEITTIEIYCYPVYYVYLNLVNA